MDRKLLEKTIDAKVKLAFDLYKQVRNDEAIRIAKEACEIKAAPFDLQPAYHCLAYILHKCRKLEDALCWARMSNNICTEYFMPNNPKYYKAKFTYAIILMELERSEEALQYLHECNHSITISTPENDIWRWKISRAMGIYCVKTNKVQEAVNYFESCLLYLKIHLPQCHDLHVISTQDLLMCRPIFSLDRTIGLYEHLLYLLFQDNKYAFPLYNETLYQLMLCFKKTGQLQVAENVRNDLIAALTYCNKLDEVIHVLFESMEETYPSFKTMKYVNDILKAGGQITTPLDESSVNVIKQAVLYAEEMLKYNHQQDNRATEKRIDMLCHTSSIFFEKKMYDLALFYANRAKDVATGTTYHVLRSKCHRLLSQIYDAQGDHQRAVVEVECAMNCIRPQQQNRPTITACSKAFDHLRPPPKIRFKPKRILNQQPEEDKHDVDKEEEEEKHEESTESTIHLPPIEKPKDDLEDARKLIEKANGCIDKKDVEGAITFFEQGIGQMEKLKQYAKSEDLIAVKKQLITILLECKKYDRVEGLVDPMIRDKVKPRYEIMFYKATYLRGMRKYTDSLSAMQKSMEMMNQDTIEDDAIKCLDFCIEVVDIIRSLIDTDASNFNTYKKSLSSMMKMGEKYVDLWKTRITGQEQHILIGRKLVDSACRAFSDPKLVAQQAVKTTDILSKFCPEKLDERIASHRQATMAFLNSDIDKSIEHWYHATRLVGDENKGEVYNHVKNLMDDVWILHLQSSRFVKSSKLETFYLQGLLNLKDKLSRAFPYSSSCNPLAFRVCSSLAELYCQLNNFANTVEYTQLMDPKDVRKYQIQCYAFVQLDKPQDAIGAINFAMTLDNITEDENFELLMELALAYLHAMQHSKMLEVINDAYQKAKQEQHLHKIFILGVDRILLNKRKIPVPHEEMLVLITKARDIASTCPTTFSLSQMHYYLCEAISFCKQEQYDIALQKCRDAMNILVQGCGYKKAKQSSLYQKLKKSKSCNENNTQAYIDELSTIIQKFHNTRIHS